MYWVLTMPKKIKLLLKSKNIYGIEAKVLQFLFLVLCIIPHVEAAQTLSTEILDELDELDGVCSDHGGRPGRSDFIEHAIIGPNQLEVWILDDGRYHCEGGALWPGRWGSDISVYARLPSGKVQKVFDIAALEAGVQSSDSSPRIWIHGWGQMCGLPEPENDEEWLTRRTCRRPLNWDWKSQKMTFAPLSELQILK